MSHPTPPTHTLPGRYPVRIPIRMTHEERAQIGRRATALHRSISRYLVELATQDGQAGKPLLLPEDRLRVQFLHSLFVGATDKVQAALASNRLTQGGGEEVEVARVCLLEVLRLLDAIGQELGRRIA